MDKGEVRSNECHRRETQTRKLTSNIAKINVGLLKCVHSTFDKNLLNYIQESIPSRPQVEGLQTPFFHESNNHLYPKCSRLPPVLKCSKFQNMYGCEDIDPSPCLCNILPALGFDFPELAGLLVAHVALFHRHISQ